jgi:hypothetical protein
VVPPGVTKEVARAEEVAVTLDPKVLEEDGEVSPLRTRQITTSPTTTGIYTGKVNTPHVVRSAMLNTKPGRTLFSIRMAPLPRTMMPGDLCPHLKVRGMGIKARVYTLL